MDHSDEIEFTSYSIFYMGVECLWVRWSYKYGNIFRFKKDGEEFVFEQIKDVDSNSDTDHILKVIEYQFLPYWAERKVLTLQKKYENLEKEFKNLTDYIKTIMK